MQAMPVSKADDDQLHGASGGAKEPIGAAEIESWQ